MLTEGESASHYWLLMLLAQEGKLTEDFLSEDDTKHLQETPYSEWPEELKEKLAPWIPDSWDNPDDEG